MLAINGTLARTTTPSQSEPGSNGNEGVINILQDWSLTIRWFSVISRSLVEWVGASYSSTEIQLAYSTYSLCRLGSFFVRIIVLLSSSYNRPRLHLLSFDSVSFYLHKSFRIFFFFNEPFFFFFFFFFFFLFLLSLFYWRLILHELYMRHRMVDFT